jgi:hypothetical protein
MLLGYARVSKADDQDTAAQVSALKAAGCTRVHASTQSRPLIDDDAGRFPFEATGGERHD